MAKMQIDTAIDMSAILDSLFRASHNHLAILCYRLEIEICQLCIQSDNGYVSEFLKFKMNWSTHLDFV